MIPELGHISLIIAFVLAIGLTVIPFWGSFRTNVAAMNLAPSLAVGILVFTATAFGLLNGLIDGTDHADASLEDIILAADAGPLFNNAAQVWNHTFYWNSMAPNGGGAPTGEVADAIGSAFGGYDAFVEKFKEAATTQFGSGWAWLIIGADGKLKVTKTPNGANPISTGEGQPILGVDVWEHAYYLDFRNVRPNYLDNFLNKLVNWEVVADLMGKGGLASGQSA